MVARMIALTESRLSISNDNEKIIFTQHCDTKGQIIFPLYNKFSCSKQTNIGDFYFIIQLILFKSGSLRQLFYFQPKNFKFLFIPSNLDLFKGDFLKIILKDSSVNSSQSFLEKFKTSFKGVNSISLFGFEKRFHGHTSWHISQPNILFSNLPFISSGINMSFNSIVK